MTRYFSDLDDGKRKYVDTTGTELADEKTAGSQAVAFLASVFKDVSPDESDRVFVVSVRDKSRVIFTTSLTLKSDWLKTGHAAATKRPVALIVDDNPVERLCAASMASDAGYDTVEAGNADEAMTVLNARSDIQVVFTDVKMPGSMDGVRLARYVRGKWPPIKIIATSGYFTIAEIDLPEGSIFLPKPYTSTKLAVALQVSAAVI